MIARDDPLDTYLVHHPAALLDKPIERVVIDPANSYVLGPQLLCAATELPLTDAEVRMWDAEAVAATLAAMGTKPTHLVCGMLNTKDVVGYMRPLAAVAETLTAVEIPGEPNTLPATDTAAAAREAEEEAGVVGAVCPVPLGSYRYRKRRGSGASRGRAASSSGPISTSATSSAARSPARTAPSM